MRSHINSSAFVVFCVRDSSFATTPLNLDLTLFKIDIIPSERFYLTDTHTSAQSAEHMRVNRWNIQLENIHQGQKVFMDRISEALIPETIPENKKGENGENR
ncbi:hypothetical protein N9219_02780 [bacterium]|nr:hypothetical protein [bacterium]